MKFYTEEGNWDMTGNNTLVFFKADPKYRQGVAEGLGHKLEEVLTSERVLSAVP